MQGNINTKNSIIKKFSSSKQYIEPIEEDSAVIDFSAAKRDVYDDDEPIKKTPTNECRLLGDDELDIRKKSIRKGGAVIIEFKIIKTVMKPYIMFKLYKNKDISLGFLRMELVDKDIPNIADAEYAGMYEYDGTQFLFFQLNDERHNVNIITSTDKTYFLLIHDIVNSRQYYNFNVDNEVTDFFIKNDKFIFLVDETDSIIETPISGFRGDYYIKIGLLAGLGMSRSGPYSSVGPYFYFGNFGRSLRYASLTVNMKPLEIMGKKITIENTPVFTKGGVVKYALFMGNSKVMMNLPTDEADDSYETSVVVAQHKFIKDTVKMRDMNGTWAKLYDSVVQTEIKIVDKELGVERVLDPQFIVKTFEQQIPIDFAYFKTDHITKNDKGLYNVSDATMI